MVAWSGAVWLEGGHPHPPPFLVVCRLGSFLRLISLTMLGEGRESVKDTRQSAYIFHVSAFDLRLLVAPCTPSSRKYKDRCYINIYIQTLLIFMDKMVYGMYLW